MQQKKKENQIKGTIFTILIILILVLLAFGIRRWTEGSDEDRSEEKQVETLSAKELEALEAKRKEEYGEFYVPLSDPKREKKDVSVKGLYISADVAAMSFQEEDIDAYAKEIEDMLEGGGPASKPETVNTLEAALAIAKATEVNALVIDVKTDWGTLAWNTDIPIAQELGVSQPVSQDDFAALLKYMGDHDIYRMARVVTFKDPKLPEIKPEHAMQLNAGGIYRDNDGNAWVNPFDEYVWKYVVAVSKEAVNRGFDEIHFDYVRFPDGARRYNQIANFPGREDRPKDWAITEFLKYAREELKDYPAKTSAAIFGTTTKNWEDVPDDIGQGFLKVSNNTDRVAPMVYPSHFSQGWFGYNVPDANPYGVLEDSMRTSVEKNAALPNPAEITPWIQAFTASWVPGYIQYTPSVIAEQIQGSQSAGVGSYLLWNSSCTYDPAIFAYEPETQVKEEGKDYMLRTPEEALTRALDAYVTGDDTVSFILSPVASRNPVYETYAEELGNSAVTIEDYSIVSFDEDSMVAEVSFKYTRDGATEEAQESLQVVLENGLYKVNPPSILKAAEESQSEEGQEVQEGENQDQQEEQEQ